MGAMPPRPARCVAYAADDTGLFFTPGVQGWFAGPNRPSPHGHLTVSGRRGAVYYIGELSRDSGRHPEWPPAVHEWLEERGNMPDALVVVWQSEH
jgi:hypothetical protein